MAFRHPDGDYAITAMYSVPDDAWYLELDLVAGQRALVTAIVPDEDVYGQGDRPQGVLTLVPVSSARATTLPRSAPTVRS